MLDIQRVLFVPRQSTLQEATHRGVVKKIVDKRFTRDDKSRILEGKGLTGEDLDRELATFSPESILPEHETDLVATPDNSTVIESGSIALSYTSGRGPEEPHWHPDEVETYLTNDAVRIAVRYLDRPMKHQVRIFEPGRIIFPPRVCHFADLRGHTEVMSFREEKLMQRVDCRRCHLFENNECLGLRKTDAGFTGEKKLVEMANERMKWISR